MKQRWIFLIIKGKEPPCSVKNLDLIPGLGRYLGEGKCYPLQWSCLENSMDYTVHGFEKSRTWLSGILLVKSMEFGTKYFGSNFSSALTSCMIMTSCFAFVPLQNGNNNKLIRWLLELNELRCVMHFEQVVW